MFSLLRSFHYIPHQFFAQQNPLLDFSLFWLSKLQFLQKLGCFVIPSPLPLLLRIPFNSILFLSGRDKNFAFFSFCICQDSGILFKTSMLTFKDATSSFYISNKHLTVKLWCVCNFWPILVLRAFLCWSWCKLRYEYKGNFGNPLKLIL